MLFESNELTVGVMVALVIAFVELVKLAFWVTAPSPGLNGRRKVLTALVGTILVVGAFYARDVQADTGQFETVADVFLTGLVVLFSSAGVWSGVKNALAR